MSTRPRSLATTRRGSSDASNPSGDASARFVHCAVILVAILVGCHTGETDRERADPTPTVPPTKKNACPRRADSLCGFVRTVLEDADARFVHVRCDDRRLAVAYSRFETCRFIQGDESETTFQCDLPWLDDAGYGEHPMTETMVAPDTEAITRCLPEGWYPLTADVEQNRSADWRAHRDNSYPGCRLFLGPATYTFTCTAR